MKKNNDRLFSGYLAVPGMEIAPNEFLPNTKDCGMDFSKFIPIRDEDENIIGEGELSKDEKGIKIKGVLK